jgi:predicted enzyme related to lactoylglutathione lyase
MIKGVHTMFYSSKVEELRKFIKEKLKFTYSDLGDGWLIFDLPGADMGCHPADEEDGSISGTHNISFYCDDINATVKELKSRGVEFVDEITNAGYGLVTRFIMPGNVEVQLYEPLYKKSAKK